MISVDAYNNIDNTLLGAYEVIYVATDASGYQATASRRVNVMDTVSPVITLNGANPMTLGVFGAFVDSGAVANDAYFGDVSVSVDLTDLCMNCLLYTSPSPRD